MKKNKGFSLVELIIVIAIMAILAAAIAPALIRYIDKSRRADDVASAGVINSSMSAALANEDIYDAVFEVSTGKAVLYAEGGAANWSLASISDTTKAEALSKEMNSSCPPPSIKFKKTTKKADTDAGADVKPEAWYVGVSEEGKPLVYIGAKGKAGDAVDAAGHAQLQPSIDKAYK